MVVFDKKKTQEVIKEKGKIEGNSLPFEYLLIFFLKICCVITVIKIISYTFLVISDHILSQDFTILLKTKD